MTVKGACLLLRYKENCTPELPPLLPEEIPETLAQGFEDQDDDTNHLMPLLSPGILHRTNAPVITEQIVQKGPWVGEIFISRWSVGRGRKGRDKPILRHEQWEAEGSGWSVHKGKTATKISHPRLLLFHCLILDQRWGVGKRVCLKINLLEFRVCLRSNQSKGEKLIVNASRRIEKPSMTTEKQVLTACVMLQRGRDEPEALARSISFYAIPEVTVCSKTPSGHLSTCPSLCHQAPQKHSFLWGHLILHHLLPWSFDTFLLIEVILIPYLPKAVGPGPHFSWPLSITGSRWAAFGVSHISLSPVFAPPSERSISGSFHLPFPYTTVEFNIQHHSPYFSHCIVFILLLLATTHFKMTLKLLTLVPDLISKSWTDTLNSLLP